MDPTTLTAIRAAIREELAPIRAQLDEIQAIVDQFPNADFLRRSDVARQVV
jgi:hypothetical protein